MTKLKPLPNELFEFYPAMSAQTHEAHVKAYAKSHLKDANTRPAAPVEGLETIEYQVEKNSKWYSDHPQSWAVRKGNGATVRELVTRSQAEAIVAAERAEKEIAERNRDAARENFLTMQKTAAKLLERAEKAEADNAALTARVKELEGEVFHDPELGITWKQICEQFDGECTHHQQRAKALETQLAAAEKIRIAAIELDAAISDDFNIFGAQQKLRAVMGGK